MVDAIGYFKASNPSELDFFGTSVAFSGDGNTLAIGAPGEEEIRGAVYVFTQINGQWAQHSSLKGPFDCSFFGSSVSLSDNGAVLAVGASDESATGGCVEVYTRTNATWTEQAHLEAINQEPEDRFGLRVTLSADGETLAVGAVGEDSGGAKEDNSVSEAGAVYVFTRAGGVWKEEAYIKASLPGEEDHFGTDVALSEDGNTLAVGAMGEDGSANEINGEHDDDAPNSGAAYVYTRTDESWEQQAYIKASNAGSDEQFGSGVALSGDGSTLAVGANKESNQQGAAYVFTRADSVWSEEAYIKAAAPGEDAFGESVALSADGSILAVGAINEDSGAPGVNGSQEDNSATDAGAAYVFRRTNNEWHQHAYIKSSVPAPHYFFAECVALSSNGESLAVGARYERSDAMGVGGDPLDDSLSASGAVYVY